MLKQRLSADALRPHWKPVGLDEMVGDRDKEEWIEIKTKKDLKALGNVTNSVQRIQHRRGVQSAGDEFRYCQEDVRNDELAGWFVNGFSQIVCQWESKWIKVNGINQFNQLQSTKPPLQFCLVIHRALPLRVAGWLRGLREKKHSFFSKSFSQKRIQTVKRTHDRWRPNFLSLKSF